MGFNVNKFVFCFSIVLCTLLCHSQSLPIYGIYRENLSLLNVASPSSVYLAQPRRATNKMSFSLACRKQWWAAPESPITINTRFEKMNIKNRWGLGLLYDEAGLVKNTQLNGNYAYNIQLSYLPYQHQLWLGLNAGLGLQNIDATKIHLNDPNAIIDLPSKKIYTDLGFGAFYLGGTNTKRRRFYLGLSTLWAHPVGNEFVLVNSLHYYGIGGYIFPLKTRSNRRNVSSNFEVNSWIRYLPNLRYISSPISATLGGRLHFTIVNPNMGTAKLGGWIGLSGATSRELQLEMGVQNIDLGRRYSLSYAWSFTSLYHLGPSLELSALIPI